MQSQTEQLEISSRLPGYLFILSFITSIGESVVLRCPEIDYDFYDSMLNLIGIRALPESEDPASKCVYFISSLQELQNVNPIECLIPGCILCLRNQTALHHSSDWKDTFLSQYPESIIVMDSKSDTTKKHFLIRINKKNLYYSRLKSVHSEQRSAD